MVVLLFCGTEFDIKTMDILILEKQFKQRGEIQSQARLSGIQELTAVRGACHLHCSLCLFDVGLKGMILPLRIKLSQVKQSKSLLSKIMNFIKIDKVNKTYILNSLIKSRSLKYPNVL